MANAKKQTPAPAQDPTGDIGLDKWKLLYRIAAVSIIGMLVIIPIQIIVYTTSPMPADISGWFALLQANPLSGLLHLDLLYIINNTILAIMYLVLYFTLRRHNESLMLIALVLGMLGIAAYYPSNGCFELLSLARQHAGASSDGERALLLASGQTYLETWKGTVFNVYYVLNAITLLLVSLVMFKSRLYGKVTATFGLVSGVLMSIPSSAGMIGMVFALASLVPWYVFSVLVARRLFRLGKLQA